MLKGGWEGVQLFQKIKYLEIYISVINSASPSGALSSHILEVTLAHGNIAAFLCRDLKTLGWLCSCWQVEGS